MRQLVAALWHRSEDITALFPGLHMGLVNKENIPISFNVEVACLIPL